ncbi:hypothetical protein GOODEAATRI_018528 [Goodea atripinnis]|uniref:Secreted protein n=1 Tax=Goodea atripinnis TaxID=208336 RepID=A0ABV0NNR1_9TELE
MTFLSCSQTSVNVVALACSVGVARMQLPSAHHVFPFGQPHRESTSKQGSLIAFSAEEGCICFFMAVLAMLAEFKTCSSSSLSAGSRPTLSTSVSVIAALLPEEVQQSG